MARRKTEVFSMSFLDCICCGFGAVILLLVVTEYGDPIRLAVSKEDLDRQVEKNEKELFDIRGTALVLERELSERVTRLKQEQDKLTRLRGDLSKIEGEYKASEDEEDAVKKLAENLASARAAMSRSLSVTLTPTLMLGAMTMAMSRAASAICSFWPSPNPVVPITALMPKPHSNSANAANTLVVNANRRNARVCEFSSSVSAKPATTSCCGSASRTASRIAAVRSIFPSVRAINAEGKKRFIAAVSPSVACQRVR